MTQCNPCTPMKTLSRCMAILTIGTIAPTTDVFVWLFNLTTGVATRFPVTSDGAGLVTVDLTDYPQIEGHDYQLYLTPYPTTNTEENMNVTISAVVYTCFALRFVTVYDDQGVIQTGDNQTLEA